MATINNSIHHVILEPELFGAGGAASDEHKQSVKAATTAAGTLASDFENGDTIDGIVLSTNDRILIKNQTSGIENGTYIVNASGAPSRAPDMPIGNEARNSIVFVQEGTVNANTGWIVNNVEGSDIVGTDALTFLKYADPITATNSMLTGSSTGIVENTQVLPNLLGNHLISATVATAGGLNVNVTSVTCFINGGLVTPTDVTPLALTDDATNFVHVNSSGVITNTTTVPSGNFMLLSTIVTESGAQTTQTDTALTAQHNKQYEAVVALDGTGDYTNPKDAFDAGFKSVYVKNGRYMMDGIINLPDGATIVGESKGGVIFDYQTQITTDDRIIAHGNNGTSTGADVYSGAGTVALTINSTTVTGTGTTFQTAGTPAAANDFLIIRGAAYQIDSIASDTSLTLKISYRGATESGIAVPDFAIMPMKQNIVLKNFTLVNWRVFLTTSLLLLEQCLNSSVIDVDISECVGGSGVGTNPIGQGLSFANCVGCIADRITSFSSGAALGISGGWKTIVRGCQFIGAQNNGILVGTSGSTQLPTTKHIISNNVIDGVGSTAFATVGFGIQFSDNSATDCAIIDNIISNCVRDGIISNETTLTETRHLILGNTITNCRIGIVTNTGNAKDTISNNKITNMTDDGVLLQGDTCTFIGNTIDTTIATGIEIASGATDNVINGNNISNTGTIGINVLGNDSLIKNNMITSSGTDGISVAASLTNVKIFANAIIDSGAYGINFNATPPASGNILLNTFRGSVTADFNNHPTGLAEIRIPSNTADALTISCDGGDPYQTYQTTTGDKAVVFKKNVLGTDTIELRQLIPSSIDSRTFKGLLRVTYDFATDGGTVAGTPTSLAQSLPDNAIVTRGFYEVTAGFTSGTSTGEFALGIVTDDTNGLLAPLVVTSLGTGYGELIQDGAASNFSNKTTASRAIQFDVTTEDLTAGTMVIFLEYVISA